jgi:hypothetical protein
MRHLRKFNESKNDIMILGDIYLAYLKDYDLVLILLMLVFLVIK